MTKTAKQLVALLTKFKNTIQDTTHKDAEVHKYADEYACNTVVLV